MSSIPRFPIACSRVITAIFAAFLLASCVAPLSFKQISPTYPARQTDAPLPPGHTLAGSDLSPAGHLKILRECHRRLLRGDATAVPEYNFHLARLVENLDESKTQAWGSEMTLQSAEFPSLRVTLPPGVHFHGVPNVIPTDTLRFFGIYSSYVAAIPGLGAPVISFVRPARANVNPQARTLTALLRFTGNSPVLELIDPFQKEKVSLGSREYPLAMDLTANVSYNLSTGRIDQLGLIRLLRPDRFIDAAAIERVQPYDSKRIPVLLVHGLQDTPASFAPMYFRLVCDPVIRKRFQFWVFTYPSGNPYPWSAVLLRRELDRMRAKHPDHQKIVIIGHSMGALLSRLMITDSGDRIWNDLTGKPLASSSLGGSSREMLEEALVFHAHPDISRAILIAAPHRGSILASNWIGRTVSRFIHLPDFLADTKDNLFNILTLDASGFTLDRAPNSIDTLSPNNQFVCSVATLPPHPHVPIHSIIGDRGRGDTPDSSDGVVAYWSSHFPPAKSEKIVPSHHRAHQNPEGIEEVRRILYHHLGLPAPPLMDHQIQPATRPSRPLLPSAPGHY